MEKEYIVECTEPDGAEVTLEFSVSENVTESGLKSALEKEGKIVTKMVSAINHHVCKKCNSIAEGSDPELLCNRCTGLTV